MLLRQNRRKHETRITMKRALIISYYWPPTGGSGVQRWVKFAKYLPQEGWQPVIYTPENPEAITTDTSLEAEIPAEAEIIKRKIFEPYEAYRVLTGSRRKATGPDCSAGSDRKDGSACIRTVPGAKADEVNPINSQDKSLSKKLSLWIRGNFFIPDPRCMWIGPSVRFLKKYLREHPVDIIISTGPPHSMHLIARRLSLSTGIPWIADFRDPWTRMFYFKHLHLSRLAQKRHEKLEKKVLDDATVAVAVSPLVKEEFQSMTSTPVELITNGFDENDFGIMPERDGHFNITHTGLFASDGNPDVLWEALAEKCCEDADFAKTMRIRLAGKTDKEITDSIRKAGLGDNLVDLGYQTHRNAVKEQKSASLLMLPLRKEPEYKATLPGKLFEYLAAGRPVLGIGQSSGAMARILSETQAGFVFEWDDKASVRKYIDICWEKFLSGTLEADTRNIEQYSRRALTRKMAALMDSLICK